MSVDEPPRGIPEEELLRFADSMRVPPTPTPCIAPQLRALGVELRQDPRDEIVAGSAIAALSDTRPFSAVRLGDGEYNLVCYRRYPGTPRLDRRAALASVSLNEDRFNVDDDWLPVLRELQLMAMAEADIIGTIGIDDETGIADASAWLDRQLIRLRDGIRFRAGMLRGRKAALELAASGFFEGRVVASAHFYLGVILNLDRLLDVANRVLLITARTDIVPGIAGRTRVPVECIAIGDTSEEWRTSGRTPAFLRKVEDGLPADMGGTLALVGAGIWAGTYCSWVKRRNGVAIDLGSGFDLLAGEAIRGNHERMSSEERQKYAL